MPGEGVFDWADWFPALLKMFMGMDGHRVRWLQIELPVVHALAPKLPRFLQRNTHYVGPAAEAWGLPLPLEEPFF